MYVGRGVIGCKYCLFAHFILLLNNLENTGYVQGSALGLNQPTGGQLLCFSVFLYLV